MSFAFAKKPTKKSSRPVDYRKLAKKHGVKLTKKTPSGSRKNKSPKELRRHIRQKIKSKRS